MRLLLAISRRTAEMIGRTQKNRENARPPWKSLRMWNFLKTRSIFIKHNIYCEVIRLSIAHLVGFLRGTDTLRTLFSCLFFKNHSKIVRARECTRSKWSLISLHQQYLRKLFHQIPMTHARTNDRCRQNGAHFASNGTASQRLTRFSWLKMFQVAK